VASGEGVSLPHRIGTPYFGRSIRNGKANPLGGGPLRIEIREESDEFERNKHP